MPDIEFFKTNGPLQYALVVALALIAAYCHKVWFPLKKRAEEARIRAHESVATTMPKLAAGFERVAGDTGRLPTIEAKIEAMHADVRRVVPADGKG